MKKTYLLIVTLSLVLSCGTAPEDRAVAELENELMESVQDVLSDETKKQKPLISEDLNAETFKLGLNGDQLQLIDVRTPEEFKDGTIDGAANIDFLSLDFEKRIEALSKDQAVYLFCKSGGRSGQAKMILKDHGFKEVYNLIGGYSQWPY